MFGLRRPPSVDRMRTPPLVSCAAAISALAILSLSAAPAYAQSTASAELRPVAVAPLPAPRRWKWRSPALVVAGIGGIVVGLPTMLLGGLTMALFSGPYSEGVRTRP